MAILACNWGGTTALTWLARGDLESAPALCGCVREYDADAAENGLDETDANRPGGLYETMLSEVSGFTARGVLWYQGESDDCRASLYAALFGRLVRRWRGDWEDDLPFLFVQLAPYGTDGGSNGNLYPGVRRAQELAAKTVPNAFMASISDVGEEDNIHPRQKRPVGHRLCLQALDKVYAIPTLSDAPTAIGGAAGQGEIRVRFAHADGLRLDGTELSALHVFEGGREAAFSAPRVEGDTLVIACAAADGKRLLRLAFAQTAYYKVNLYNAADIPAIPFEMEL